MRDVSTTVSATGTVRLKSGAEVRVGAQLSGIVRRLNITVGSQVHAGDVIAEIDDRPVRAKIDQAQTQLAQSQVALAKSKTDLWREQKLFEAGVVPRQQLDDSAAAFAAAQAAVTAAESSLAAAKVDLTYVEIRAPIGGTIASVSTLQGETVAASFATPTFVTIIQQSALEVVAMVDEADIGNVRPGLSVSFTTETYPDREFTGKVARIAPVATIVSGVVNYEVAISIGRDVASLKPDMTTNVSVVTAKHRALLLPSGCIHKQDGQTFVYVRILADTPLKRTVATGTRTANGVEITSGLGPNDSVLMKPYEGAS
jgi:RND family efflux transporter MFP subunit